MQGIADSFRASFFRGSSIVITEIYLLLIFFLQIGRRKLEGKGFSPKPAVGSSGEQAFITETPVSVCRCPALCWALVQQRKIDLILQGLLAWLGRSGYLHTQVDTLSW